ncbi:MAG: HAD family hydrolase [Sedimentisphaerales bacterium]|nr:HAD family hydrolase [Sedimentisphaerales bacterium]
MTRNLKFNIQYSIFNLLNPKPCLSGVASAKTDALNPVKAVIFDLGDTLLNFGKVNISELFRQAAKHSYEYLKELNQPVGDFQSYCRANLRAIRWKYWVSLFTGRDFDAKEALKKVNQKRGISLSEQQWDEIVWLWYKPLSDVATAESDIKETLTKLKNMGLKLGILSNTFVNNTALERHLAQYSIVGMFDVRLYSYQFPFRKPKKQIFLEAAKLIGRPAENIMFVGDKISKDIKPALKIGMTAVLKSAYTNHNRSVPRGAYKISKISELPALIKQINTPSI